MVKQINTKEEFDALLASSGSKLVVVDFTATWCPPCRAIAPKFAELSEKVEGYATLVKVDVDENSATASAAGIQCMPTFQFYKDGEKIYQLEGADFETLAKKIEELK